MGIWSKIFTDSPLLGRQRWRTTFSGHKPHNSIVYLSSEGSPRLRNGIVGGPFEGPL